MPVMETDIFTELEIFARTLYGEARGEGLCGMAAVASTVLNRVKNPCWWGSDIRSVCLKAYQYSCWLPKDPNRAILLSKLDTDASYSKCLIVASLAMKGLLVDSTQGATHYFDKRLPVEAWPDWAAGIEPCLILGHHMFYKNIK